MQSFVQLGRKPDSGRGGPSADPRARFLPTTREEMAARGWDELDILIVTGDAYVDHPAFGPSSIARFLEGRGFKVGIIAQPQLGLAGRHRAHGRAAALRRRHRRQPRLDAQQADGAEEGALARISTRRAAAPSMRPNRATHRLLEPLPPGVPRRARSCSAASRPRCAASRTTTTGPIRSAARSCSTPRPTCSSSAWASARRGRSRGASTRGETVARAHATCAAPRTC